VHNKIEHKNIVACGGFKKAVVDTRATGSKTQQLSLVILIEMLNDFRSFLHKTVRTPTLRSSAIPSSRVMPSLGVTQPMVLMGRR
jgi:hypothetical protein